MTNPSKDKGTRAETALARHFNRHGIPTDRRPPKGNQDDGDLWAHGGKVVIEVKWRKTRQSDEEIQRMWGEVNREAAKVPNCEAAALIINRPGRGETRADQWWAVLTAQDWAWLCGLDPDELHPQVALSLVTTTVACLTAAIATCPNLP